MNFKALNFVMFCLGIALALSLSNVDGLSIRSNDHLKSRRVDMMRIIPSIGDVLSNDQTGNDKETDKVTNPDFCHDLDCPAYKVVIKTDDYELREYDASQWVSTTQLNLGYDDAASTMFMRLFNYIQGKNSLKQKIDMTAPVLDRVIPGQGPACENNFTMSFFMSPKVKNPPTPTDTAVFLNKIPKQKFFVSYFGGYEHGKDWVAHANQMAAKLHADKKKFDASFFYTAGYDSPFHILFRHNEIWFAAQE